MHGGKEPRLSDLIRYVNCASVKYLPCTETRDGLENKESQPSEMPIPILAEAIFNGVSSIPFATPILKTAPWLILIYLLKTYFGGASNTSERLMHSKVVVITVHKRSFTATFNAETTRAAHRASAPQSLGLLLRGGPRYFCSLTTHTQTLSWLNTLMTSAPIRLMSSSTPSKLTSPHYTLFVNSRPNGLTMPHPGDLT